MVKIKALECRLDTPRFIPDNLPTVSFNSSGPGPAPSVGAGSYFDAQRISLNQQQSDDLFSGYNTQKKTPSQNILLELEKQDLGLHFEGKRNGTYKIVDGPIDSTPLMRFDSAPHEFGDKHIQWGEKDFTGRVGNEATDIFGEVFKQVGGRLKFPWEK